VWDVPEHTKASGRCSAPLDGRFFDVGLPSGRIFLYGRSGHIAPELMTRDSRGIDHQRSADMGIAVADEPSSPSSTDGENRGASEAATPDVLTAFGRRSARR